MPRVSLLTGGLDFSNKFVVLKAAKDGTTAVNTPADAVKMGAVTWNYGNFITLVINFAIVAFAVFLLVRAINKMNRSAKKEPVSKECPACAMTIPIKATRCPHCTTQLSTARDPNARLVCLRTENTLRRAQPDTGSLIWSKVRTARPRGECRPHP